MEAIAVHVRRGGRPWRLGVLGAQLGGLTSWADGLIWADLGLTLAGMLGPAGWWSLGLIFMGQVMA